jgi:hypothetical protein
MIGAIVPADAGCLGCFSGRGDGALVAIDIFCLKCYCSNYLIVIPLFFSVIFGKSL